MHKLTQFFEELFGAKLSEDFVPRASYYQAMDYLEYVSRDTTCVYDRVDEYLTLIYDRDREAIGFKIKGFKYFFNTVLKSEYPELDDDHFIPLVEVIQKLLTKVGLEAFPPDDPRKHKYEIASSIADKNKVAFNDYAAMGEAA